MEELVPVLDTGAEIEMSSWADVQAQQRRYYAPELLFCQTKQSAHSEASRARQ
ncbi:MAG: hypothetical protein ACK2U1_15060 [Anaerolineales bacterium]